MKKKAIICDIDDTVVVEKDYSPINNVIDFLKENSDKYTIIMLTARLEKLRNMTIKQLSSLGIKYNQLIMDPYLDQNHENSATVEHAIYKANEVRKVMVDYDVVLFIDNSKHARHEVKKLGITTKKPENIKPKVLTKNLWSGIFIS